VDFFAADCPNDDITMTHFRAVIARMRPAKSASGRRRLLPWLRNRT
jgi:hypothetical protein